MSAVFKIYLFLDCGTAIDLIFVLDGSASINDGAWTQEKGCICFESGLFDAFIWPFAEFLKSVASYFYPSNNATSLTRLGIVTFSSAVLPQFFLGNYSSRNDILCAIDGITRDTMLTFIGSAFRYVRTVMFSASAFVAILCCNQPAMISLSWNSGARGSDVPKVAVLITGTFISWKIYSIVDVWPDGVASLQQDPYNIFTEAALMQAQGISVFCIGIRDPDPYLVLALIALMWMILFHSWQASIQAFQLTTIASLPTSNHLFWLQVCINPFMYSKSSHISEYLDNWWHSRPCWQSQYWNLQ